MDFESSIKDPTVPISIDFDPQRGILFLAFAGFGNRVGFPVLFEFNKSTSGFKNINKIFLRDRDELWYHHGLANIGENIDGIATFLRQYTNHPATRRTVIFGNSAGGYAALLLSHLLQADEVHAFAPRTFIDPFQRLFHKDFPRIKTALWLLRNGQRKYFDLREVFLTAPDVKRNAHIYYSTGQKTEIDNVHANWLQGIPGVHFHVYQNGKHNLIKDLKQSGELNAIIARAILLPG
jgi:hypothetical protein